MEHDLSEPRPTVLDHLAQEPEPYRQHSDCYAYEFFVARRAAEGAARSLPLRGRI